jgi:hypothetical protein
VCGWLFISAKRVSFGHELARYTFSITSYSFGLIDHQDKMKRGCTTLTSSTSTHQGDEGSIEGRTSFGDDLMILFKNVMN